MCRTYMAVRTSGCITFFIGTPVGNTCIQHKRDMRLLTNIHDPPREGNYRNEHGNAIKLAIVVNCNRHMGHVDNSNRLTNSYTVSR